MKKILTVVAICFSLCATLLVLAACSPADSSQKPSLNLTSTKSLGGVTFSYDFDATEKVNSSTSVDRDSLTLGTLKMTLKKGALKNSEAKTSGSFSLEITSPRASKNHEGVGTREIERWEKDGVSFRFVGLGSEATLVSISVPDVSEANIRFVDIPEADALAISKSIVVDVAEFSSFVSKQEETIGALPKRDKEAEAAAAAASKAESEKKLEELREQADHEMAAPTYKYKGKEGTYISGIKGTVTKKSGGNVFWIDGEDGVEYKCTITRKDGAEYLRVGQEVTVSGNILSISYMSVNLEKALYS